MTVTSRPLAESEYFDWRPLPAELGAALWPDGEYRHGSHVAALAEIATRQRDIAVPCDGRVAFPFGARGVPADPDVAYVLTVALPDGWTWGRLANLADRHVTGADRPSRLARLLLAEALAARA